MAFARARSVWGLKITGMSAGSSELRLVKVWRLTIVTCGSWCLRSMIRA